MGTKHSDILVKGVSHEFFYLHFFMIRIHLAPDIKAKVFSNFVSISPRYSIIKLENSESPTSKFYRLSKSTFYYFNDRRISPDCSFKSNLRQVEFSIMTLQCAV